MIDTYVFIVIILKQLGQMSLLRYWFNYYCAQQNIQNINIYYVVCCFPQISVLYRR